MCRRYSLFPIFLCEGGACSVPESWWSCRWAQVCGVACRESWSIREPEQPASPWPHLNKWSQSQLIQVHNIYTVGPPPNKGHCWDKPLGIIQYRGKNVLVLYATRFFFSAWKSYIENGCVQNDQWPFVLWKLVLNFISVLYSEWYHTLQLWLVVVRVCSLLGFGEEEVTCAVALKFVQTGQFDEVKKICRYNH